MSDHFYRAISLLMRKKKWTEDDEKKVGLITDLPFANMEEGKLNLQKIISTKQSRKVIDSMNIEKWILFNDTGINRTALNNWADSLEEENEVLPSMKHEPRLLRAIKYFLQDYSAIYYDMHKCLSIQQRFVFILDAPPGSGKSGLARLFGISLADTSLKMLTANADKVIRSMTHVGSEALHHPILKTFNICKLLMSMFRMEFQEAVEYFKDGDQAIVKMTDVQRLYASYSLIFRYNYKIVGETGLLILDEYSLTAPELLYVFVALSKIKRFSLLFVGDNNQITAIDKSRFHVGGNLSLLSPFANVYTTSVQKRMDEEYYHHFEKLKRMMEQTRKKVLPFDFRFKYAVFQAFLPAYFGTPNYDSIFFALHHNTISKRIREETNYLASKGFPTYTSYYKVMDEEMSTKEEPVYRDLKPTPEQYSKWRKYLLEIPITQNRQYWYHPPETPKSPFPVKLINFDEHNDQCTVTTIDGSRTYSFGRQKYIARMLTKDYLETLLKLGLEQEFFDINFCEDRKLRMLMNFPITPLCSTFHSAQGCTINNMKIDVDLRCKEANEAYMILSRIVTISQLNYIHCDDLLNLIITDYYHKTSGKLSFYYSLGSRSSNDVVMNLIKAELGVHIDNRLRNKPTVPSRELSALNFITTNSLAEFKGSNSDMKIDIAHFNRFELEGKSKLVSWMEYSLGQANFDMIYSKQLPLAEFEKIFDSWSRQLK